MGGRPGANFTLDHMLNWLAFIIKISHLCGKIAKIGRYLFLHFQKPKSRQTSFDWQCFVNADLATSATAVD